MKEVADQWADWKREILEPLLSPPPLDPSPLGGDEGGGEALEELLARPEADLALLSADIDRIQDYVFESERLPEIRGGSMLLAELNEGEAELEAETPQNIKGVFQKHGLPQDCVIYTGGGSLLALVPASIASDLQKDIEELYPRRTKAATITCVQRMVTPEELLDGHKSGLNYEELLALRERLTDEEWQQRVVSYLSDVGEIQTAIGLEEFKRRRGFKQMRALIGAQLRRRKESKATAPFHEAIPFAMRCQSCQTRPAARILDLFGEPWPLCPVCALKQEGKYSRKSQWVAEFEGFLKGEGQELYGRYYAQTDPRGIDIPHDLSEIGQACLARPGYVGFIYADGDGVGSFVEEQSTLWEYRENSRKIKKAIQGAVYQALAEGLQPCQVNRCDPRGRVVGQVWIHPFEVLTFGGDDALLLVPGDAAFPTALRICQLFERSAPPRNGHWPLTMSAGVAIADAHNPVRFLRDLADDLLEKSAKRRAGEARTGAIDFQILKSQSMMGGTVEEMRGSPPYRFEAAGEVLQLTHRPYTLDEAARLLKTLKIFLAASFPRGQLQALAEALFQGRQASTLFYLYQSVRLGEKARAALQAMEREWRLQPDRTPSPWVKVEDGEVNYKTMLLDMAELYDFVPRGPEVDIEGLWQEILADGR